MEEHYDLVIHFVCADRNYIVDGKRGAPPLKKVIVLMLFIAFLFVGCSSHQGGNSSSLQTDTSSDSQVEDETLQHAQDILSGENAINILAYSLADEVDANTADKYLYKELKIVGDVVEISKHSDMTGYYFVNTRASGKTRVVCWFDPPYPSIKVGEHVEIIGLCTSVGESTELVACRIPISKESDSSENINKDEIYRTGTYLVGEHIPAGKYIISTALEGRYTVLFNSGGDREETIFTFDYVTLEEGDVIIIYSNCIATPASDEHRKAIIRTDAHSGTFEIGTDIPAGMYKLEEVNGCILPCCERLPMGNYLIFDGCGAGARVVGAGTVEGTKSIELKEGQYIRISKCKIVSE